MKPSLHTILAGFLLLAGSACAASAGLYLELRCFTDGMPWTGRDPGDSHSVRLFPGEEVTCEAFAIVEDAASAVALTSPDPAAAGLQLVLVPNGKVTGEPTWGRIARPCWTRLTDPSHLIWQRRLEAAPQPQDPGYRVTATFVLRYAELPQGHSRILAFVPAEALGSSVKPGIAGFVTRDEVLLVGPPRSVAEEDWSQLRHAMREQAAGRRAEAERIARLLLVSHPLRTTLIAYLAELVEQQERPAEAAALFREAARIGRAGLDADCPPARGLFSPAWESELKSWEVRAAQLEARAAPR